jgi:hypothetical protein
MIWGFFSYGTKSAIKPIEPDSSLIQGWDIPEIRFTVLEDAL